MQRKTCARTVEVLEAVEAVARVAHHLAGLRDVAELPGEFQQAGLGADDLLVLGHWWAWPPVGRGGRGYGGKSRQGVVDYSTTPLTEPDRAVPHPAPWVDIRVPA